MNKPILKVATGLFAILAAVTVAAQTYTIPADTPANIRRAVESADRPDAARARDAGRKPAHILTLAGIEEGDHVAELTSFGQYYTPMLVDAVGPTGMVEMYDLPVLAAFQEGGVGRAGQAFADARANVNYTIVEYNDISLPAGLDIVFNILSYHDFPAMGVDPATLNAHVFNALKSGGRYVVVDHAAAPGSGWDVAGSIHRIEKRVIVDEVTAAGFVLAADSDVLAHPEDDHSSMVFAMRGDTDRSVLVFRKP